MGTDYADATLTIDLDALVQNYSLLKEKAHSAECASVVKANAYGLGISNVAPKLASAGCNTFFVANLDEAIELRSLLPSVTIYIFHGVRPGQEQLLCEHNLIPVLNDIGQAQCWSDFAKQKNKQLSAILHIDTGMNRLGLNQHDIEKLDNIANLQFDYIMSHLACANNPSDPLNTKQLEEFNNIKKHFPNTPITLANSSGIFLGEAYHGDLVRPGIALYGSNPTKTEHNPMNDVVSLDVNILQIRETKTSQTVGYGATKEVPTGTRLATLPLGYADGYLRCLGNVGHVYVGEVAAPIVGRISMDLIVVDITHISQDLVNIGTPVTLIGRHVPIDLVAKQAHTISYEILTRLGSRFKRIYKGDI